MSESCTDIFYEIGWVIVNSMFEILEAFALVLESFHLYKNSVNLVELFAFVAGHLLIYKGLQAVEQTFPGSSV